LLRLTTSFHPEALSNNTLSHTDMKLLFPTPVRTMIALAGASALASPVFGASLRFTVPAGADNSLLGSALAAAGDWNADGIPDLAIGDPGASAGAGQALVVSGADGTVLHTFAGAAGQASGTALAVLDANGDGTPDLAVGAPGGSGAVSILSGADGSVLQTVTAASPGAGSLFGAALAAAGDQNADGKDDLFVGAPGTAANNGSVLVISGADGALIRTLTPVAVGGEFGAALSAVADLNSDGLADVAVGAPGTNAGNGAVKLVLSSDGTESAFLDGTIAGARLGARLGGVDDRNADSVADLVAGSGSGGSAFVVSGSSLAVLSDLTLAGAAAGQPVSSGGALDVDFNGSTELLIGYPGASPLPRAEFVPAPVAPEPNVYEAAAAGSGLGTAVAVIPGLGFAIGEPLTAGGAVHVYTAAVDTDGDGVPDIDDHCPDSILTPTVVFGDVDTGVENRVDEHGCSIADLFAALEPESGWRNHGKFVSSSVKLVKRLLRDGTIDASEAQALRSGAAQSNVGQGNKPPKPEKPTKPTKPQKPAKPGKPEKPEKPNKPNRD
jgi:hypothetical protein